MAKLDTDMDKTAVNNRLLVMMAGAIVSPWLDQRFAIKLSPVDTAALIVLAFHYGAASLTKGWAVFQSYFPPKVKPVEPAKVV